MMTPKDILISKDIFVGHEMIGNISCAVGYIKRFRLQWFATQLNTFVFIGESMDRIDRATIESFSSDCLAFALENNKGWPRGLQSGVCSIAILQGSNIDQEAQTFCASFSKKHWSAFEVPVLYQIDEQKTIGFVKKPIWGAIYNPFISTIIDEVTGKMRLGSDPRLQQDPVGKRNNM